MALNMRAPSRAPVRKKKSIDAQAVLDRLEGYLEGKIPEPMQWLVRFWEAQAAAFTYQELRAVAANQTAPDAFFAQWYQDYSRLMESRMTDVWRDAFLAGSRSVLEGLGDDVISPTEDAVRRWTLTHSGDLITRVTNDQIEAVRYILAEAHSKRMGVEEAARYIRPIVGLTRPQAESNLKLYEKVKENLRRDHPRMKDETVERRAREAAAKYAGEQQRYRAQLIAETEMLSAYNHGADEAVRQNMSMGLMPVMRKVWSTAMNGRVCEACQDLEGMEVGMDEEYSVQIHSKRDPERVLRTLTTLVPPLHPRCHCALMYVESTVGAGTADQALETDSLLQAPEFGEQDDGQLLRSGDLREALGDEDFAEYSRIIATNPYEEIKTLYYNYGFDATEYNHYEHGGSYNPFSDELRFSYPTHPERHKYSILAHEDGHKMDYRIDGSLDGLTFDGVSKLDNALLGYLSKSDNLIRPSQSDRFMSALRADKEAIETMRKKDPIKWDGILYALREHNYTHGAQDLLSGLYGRYDFGLIWGHGDEYYDRIYHIARDKVGIGLVRYRLSDQGIETTGPQSLRKLCREYVTGTELWANIQSAVVLRNEAPGAFGVLKVLAPESVKAYLEITGMVLR